MPLLWAKMRKQSAQEVVRVDTVSQFLDWDAVITDMIVCSFWGVSCLALTLIGTTLPYIFEWSHHVEHVCSNCEQVVMRRKGTLLGSDGKVETYGAVREEKIDEAKRSAAIRYYTRDSSKKPWKISSQPSNQK